MNRKCLMAFGLLALGGKLSRAAETSMQAPDETSASSVLRPAARLSIGKPAWGREVNGLQAGISFPDGANNPYQVEASKTAFFYVVARNTGKTPVSFEIAPASLDDACNGSFSTRILDEKKRAVSAKDVANERPDVCIYAKPLQMTLAPGEVKRIWSAKFKVHLLHLQSDSAPRDALALGAYRIGYTLDLKKSGEKEGAWVGKIETGQLAFEVAPDAKKK